MAALRDAQAGQGAQERVKTDRLARLTRTLIRGMLSSMNGRRMHIEPSPQDVADAEDLIAAEAAEFYGLTECPDCGEQRPNCSPNCDDCYGEASMAAEDDARASRRDPFGRA